MRHEMAERLKNMAEIRVKGVEKWIRATYELVTTSNIPRLAMNIVA